ncbi:hypothetical protein MHYP_G00094380 [Metynnis hypsauchen]
MAHIPHVLLDTLEDFQKEDLKKFKWHLSNSGGKFQPISKAVLEEGDSHDTVDKIVARYGPHEAVKVTLTILMKMNQMHLHQKLEAELKNDVQGTHKDCASLRAIERARHCVRLRERVTACD